MNGKKVREVMTPTPVQVPPATSVGDVASLMRARGVGSVLVVDGTGIVGLVTYRDLVVRVLANDHGPDSQVGASATVRPLCVAASDDVDSVVELMRAYSVSRVPVLEKGVAVGIVSLGDLAAARIRASLPGDAGATASASTSAFPFGIRPGTA
ncbi:CBS domain-containing protein [Catenulispora rubra]|uniref:CBS domain-containing protein n=1 Tax=Catenulispora rubra TaxID=280293 RepID=UPI002B276036|nr:CBS domain-containing protein [Catenulispora rubra]